eukprot:s5254_g4.t1
MLRAAYSANWTTVPGLRFAVSRSHGVNPDLRVPLPEKLHPFTRSQRAVRCDVVDRKMSTSTVPEDKPPRPICIGDLERMVEEARRPLKAVGLRHTQLSRTSYGYRYRSTLRGWSRRAASTAHCRDRKKGLQSNIDANYLLDLVLAQGGLCAYSGIPMELLMPNSHWRLSIERLNNRDGYLKGNCCLIAAEFNSAVHTVPDEAGAPIGSAQWSKRKVQDLVHVRTEQVQLQMLQEGISLARLRPSPTRPTSYVRFRSRDAQGRWLCEHCGSIVLGTTCKQCKSDVRLAWQRTVRGQGLELLNSARQRARRGMWAGTFNLDFDAVLDMLWIQGGRCYYSGVPLHCAKGPADWVWSIERLDNSVTYTKENCVLIAREFQTSDQSRNKAKYPVFGTAQWSRRKASHIWGPYWLPDVDLGC